MVDVGSLPDAQQPANEFCSEQAELPPHSHFLSFLKTHTWFIYIYIYIYIYIFFYGKEGNEKKYVEKKQLLPH